MASGVLLQPIAPKCQNLSCKNRINEGSFTNVTVSRHPLITLAFTLCYPCSMAFLQHVGAE